MGTGLGLPIVKKLLEEQNSDLKIDSQAGTGTQVFFSLRFKISTEKNSTEKVISDDTSTLLKGYSFLAVDDNKINQIVTKKFIEKNGGLVTTVGSGKEAIAAVKESEYDLILMDINMPEMNGFEATEAIRKFNTTIPIVALTAVEEEKVIGDNAFHLMNDIIIKPFTNQSFLEVVRKQLKTFSK